MAPNTTDPDTAFRTSAGASTAYHHCPAEVASRKRPPPPRSSPGARDARSLVSAYLLSYPPYPTLLSPVQTECEREPIVNGL